MIESLDYVGTSRCKSPCSVGTQRCKSPCSVGTQRCKSPCSERVAAKKSFVDVRKHLARRQRVTCERNSSPGGHRSRSATPTEHTTTTSAQTQTVTTSVATSSKLSFSISAILASDDGPNKRTKPTLPPCPIQFLFGLPLHFAASVGPIQTPRGFSYCPPLGVSDGGGTRSIVGATTGLQLKPVSFPHFLSQGFGLLELPTVPYDSPVDCGNELTPSTVFPWMQERKDRLSGIFLNIYFHFLQYLKSYASMIFYLASGWDMSLRETALILTKLQNLGLNSARITICEQYRDFQA